MLLEIDDREFAHVLIGLRMLQQIDPDVLEQGSEHFMQVRGFPPMTAEEIDGLCASLNCSQGEQIFLVWDPDQFHVMGAAHKYDDALAVAEQLDDVVIRPFLTGMPAKEPADGEDG